MGRLEDIIDRNKHPGKHRKARFPMGLMVAAFVLLILILMIFTDAGVGPPMKPAPPQAGPPGDKRVDGVLLYHAPARRDAGTDAAQPR